MIKCVDSCILGSSRGFLEYYYVRGYEHPIRGYIVEPYRGATCGGKRRGNQILAVENTIPYFGRSVYLLDLSDVHNVINPLSALEVTYSYFPARIRSLIEALASYQVGLTGSWAIGCEKRDSDIDLVIYEFDEDLIRILQRYADQGLIKQCRSLNLIIRKRNGRRDISTLYAHVANSLLDSCFQGVPYTIRILRRNEPQIINELENRYIKLGSTSIFVKIENTGIEGYLTPARYRSKILRILDQDSIAMHSIKEVLIESWRTRYTEIRPGNYIVKGELFLDLWEDIIILSPDFEGGIWKV